MGRKDRELGIGMYTLLYLKGIRNYQVVFKMVL